MKLYGKINYHEWSTYLTSQFINFDLLSIIEGRTIAPPETGPDLTKAEVETKITFQQRNAHARKLIIDALSDEIYTEVFAQTHHDKASEQTLSSAKSLWDDLKGRYQEKDVLKSYLALQRTLMTPYDPSKTSYEVHIQTFIRAMARLNDLAESHGLDKIPEWCQTTMLFASVAEATKTPSEAMANAKMKQVGKMKMRDLAGDMLEGGLWAKEVEVRRGAPVEGMRKEERRETETQKRVGGKT